MSLWDHIKPKREGAVATAIDLSTDKRVLTVTWDDETSTRLSARTLRQYCPCAACVDEWTNKRRHDIDKVPESTTIENIAAVGNYAVAFGFSDRHDTGIFTWEVLRELADSHALP